MCGAERLHAVQERVRRGRTALDPLREAVAACAAVVGRHIDRARRAPLDDARLDAFAPQRAVVQRGDHGRPDLFARVACVGRPAVAEGVRHGYSAAWPLVTSPALTTCDSP